MSRRVSPPGSTLQELLNNCSMTQADLARAINRPAKTINEIVKGKAAITPATAIQLESVFKTISAEFWLMREAQYRINLLKRKAAR